MTMLFLLFLSELQLHYAMTLSHLPWMHFQEKIIHTSCEIDSSQDETLNFMKQQAVQAEKEKISVCPVE
jgi:hypothetical protein